MTMKEGPDRRNIADLEDVTKGSREGTLGGL